VCCHLDQVLKISALRFLLQALLLFSVLATIVTIASQVSKRAL
jgi:hypothetical protein